jgi:ribosomal protein S12 methylthiotransferase accessory factor
MTTNTNETFIPSKDASLESSIATLQSKLLALDIHVEEKSWLNEVEGIWSVHVINRDCPRLFTNGKGASQLAARASALGEYFERLGTNYLWTDFYLGEKIANAAFVHYPNEKWFAVEGDVWPVDILTPELQQFYNPEGRVTASQLIDLNSGNQARGICAIPYTRLRDGKTVFFPVNLIGNIYVSNGMSAGNTIKEARTQALAEIFERNIKNKIIAEGICLPDVPEEVIARYPRIAAAIKGLRDAGYGILVKDASLGGQYPVMNVTLLHPDDQGCFASFGAHPRFEVALERSLTELIQGRALDSLTGFVKPGFDMEEIADPQNLEIHFVDSSGVISWEFLRNTPDYHFVDWNFGTTTEEDYLWSVNKIQESGHDLYIADFEHLGVYACRIFVPGMSEIYPVEELEWQNNSVGNQVRPYVKRLQALTVQESAELLDILLNVNFQDDLHVYILIGLCVDANTPWQDLRIGELKTLAAIAAGDADEILDGCEWIAQINDLSNARLKVYSCIADLVQIAQDTISGDISLFEANLALMYGEATLQQALSLFNQETQYFGLNDLGNNYEGSKMHQQLLAAYEKVRAPQYK